MTDGIGFQWVDPLTAFGEMSSLVLTTSIILIVGFLVSSIFIYLYKRKFYSITETPKGWRFFFIGLLLSSLYQLLKVPFTYRWVFGDILLLLFIMFQVLAIAVLAYGLYLLKKEVS